MHRAVRPAWTCGGCGLDWPCPTRRQELVAEYAGAGVSLMLYLAACFVDACQDMPAAIAGNLYGRFLLWPHTAASDAWNRPRSGVDPGRGR
ncbi:MAG: flavin reductase [Dactylosporangium sp.]|nr:flavin reductase [Dactylosporangium sp.]NNJ59687.1 flavin reductase [Dactylosporangium sp.]